MITRQQTRILFLALRGTVETDEMDPGGISFLTDNLLLHTGVSSDPRHRLRRTLRTTRTGRIVLLKSLLPFKRKRGMYV